MKILPEKTPFEFTPHIFRYLETIIDVSEKTYAPETGDEINIDNYVGGEAKSPEIDLNNQEFWGYLEKIGAIKLNAEKGLGGLKVGMTIEAEIVESAGIHSFYLAKTSLQVLSITKVKTVLGQREARKIIHPKTLELIARDMAGRHSGTELIAFLRDIGIPNKLIVYPETKWRMLHSVFRVLATSFNERANRMLYKIIEGAVHPLFFNGDEETAKQTEEKYNGWLKYNRIAIDKGKIYLAPTSEEMDLGITEWFDSDGNQIEPKGYTYDPHQIATLWVLWSQLINIVVAYTASTGNRPELEKLYLRIIGMVEDILETKLVGALKDNYHRPFTSLQTAQIEARARQFNLPILELLSPFLIEITALNPDPMLMSKKMEEHSDLLSEISLAVSMNSSEPLKVIGAFDPKSGILKFAGQDIELSNSGKHTDAVLLMTTLLKAEPSEWMHNDEILRDWGYNEDDTVRLPKKKVYFAAKKVNTTVAIKTKVEDLIDFNTAKARINPKYLKVGK